jgi:hypothetical protein
MVQAANGKFYGSTDFGATYKRDTMFSITTTGSFASLHTFNKGINPMPNPLVQGADGNFYGTTEQAKIPRGDGLSDDACGQADLSAQRLRSNQLCGWRPARRRASAGQ